jgi:hypothetical protein
MDFTAFLLGILGIGLGVILGLALSMLFSKKRLV